MNIKISPKKLCGEIKAIASKSYAIRILIASALADKPTAIHMNGGSRDIDAAKAALSALGAEFTEDDGILKARPGLIPKSPVIPCGESGTAARLILPVAAAKADSGTITGEGSLVSRPFTALCDAMEENGCRFACKSLPIVFNSRLRHGAYKISGGESSQYISGLMLGLPLLDGDSEIILTSPPESAGYIDMTIDILQRFGVEISPGYRVRGGQRYTSPSELTVEGDWSNAAFWLAAGVEVSGLNPCSLQRDRLFLELMDLPEIDAAQVPDLVPILAVRAATRHGTTRIFNARRLRLKESDRLETVSRMLNDLGGRTQKHGDELIITGGGLTGGVTDGCGDHRIVMSAAIAACFCENEVIITNAQAVEKSYPGFFADYNSLGGEARVVGIRE